MNNCPYCHEHEVCNQALQSIQFAEKIRNTARRNAKITNDKMKKLNPNHWKEMSLKAVEKRKLKSVK